jgi:regulator of protease activity HflC (stomatin/prohibitin superfamily)
MPALLIIAFITAILLSGIRIAQEYQRGVVFRLGRYTGLQDPGCTGSFHSASRER